MFQAFLVPFITTFLTEFLDKSQVSILLLGSKTKNHFHLFWGIMLAFLIVDGMAILLGAWLTSVVSPSVIRIISGVLFIAFGLLSLRGGKEDEPRFASKKTTFLTGFSMIFVAEMGDKTQLSAALFATQFSPYMVFLGVLSALMILTIITLSAGKLLTKRVNASIIHKVSGVVFILLGIFFLLGK